ncbi:glycosyltransferase family A protein [Agromyces bauzanensis]
MTDQLLATVVILTYNGETYLREILEYVLRQQVHGAFEVLVIDSGSTDSTLDIIRDFPDVRLHEIPNSEFGHGRTRNLAAQLARGRYVAYLTHDAIPVDERWLRELLAPFEIDERIVAVLGNQRPRPDAPPIVKYEILRVFSQFGPALGTTIYAIDSFAGDEAAMGFISFYSDVNSAARRSILVDRIPYRDVRYAEDQMFGRDVIEAGLWKAYSARAVVEHSNDLTFAEYGKRMFDETVALREIGHDVVRRGPFARYARAAYGALRDAPTILRDGHYSWKRKLYWTVVNPVYHLRKWSAYGRAARVDLGDRVAISRGSLEHERKLRGRAPRTH